VLLGSANNARSSRGRSTAKDLVESATEVRVEDVIDDGIDHGTAVLQPLEGGDHARRDERLTALTGAEHSVGQEEREVERDEDGKQDAEDTDSASAAVRALQRRPGPATIGREATGLGVVVAGGTRTVDRREERLDLGLGPRLTGCGRVPDLCPGRRHLQATQPGAVVPAVDAQLVDSHAALLA